ncbi:MAG: histidine phosphatase family protein [Clostridium sp.]|uniref:histidine phosphatase family protein n=1 Tax=Clostridium sp. TaxID=1506 RepID=UPI002907241F|nr:histidine phosphatase family protein [Clostridium sp.]MDU7338528.1 histidine phosphatase family protein [Clostridium sp.]
MKSYLIHVIRHGVTEANALGQYVGRTDSPLSEQGIEQLMQMKEQQDYPAVQAYYSSPLARCVQTMQILYPEAQPKLIEDLRECDFGDWEGKTAKELENNPEFLRWIESGQQAAPPNGEDSKAFISRVCTAFEKLVEELLSSGTTSAAVVMHGGVMMALLSAYGLPRASAYEWMTEPGCGYTLRITPGLWMRSMVAEVIATIPNGDQGTLREHTVIDLAREAANRAYGKEEHSEN